MTTIFFQALKDLMFEKLQKVATTQQNKKEGYLQDAELSEIQCQIITQLMQQISVCDDGNKDRDSVDKINDLIDTAIQTIGKARTAHKKPPNAGDTVTNLNECRMNARAFFNRVAEFSKEFPLLNAFFDKRVPKDIVCYHAAVYLGQNIFSHTSLKPKSQATRKQKEDALRACLQEFNTVRTLSLADQITWTLKRLTELARDNTEIVKGKKKSLSMPGVSFMGFDLTLPLKSASGGSLGLRIKAAKIEITKLQTSLATPHKEEGKQAGSSRGKKSIDDSTAFSLSSELGDELESDQPSSIRKKAEGTKPRRPTLTAPEISSNEEDDSLPSATASSSLMALSRATEKPNSGAGSVKSKASGSSEPPKAMTSAMKAPSAASKPAAKPSPSAPVSVGKGKITSEEPSSDQEEEFTPVTRRKQGKPAASSGPGVSRYSLLAAPTQGAKAKSAPKPALQPEIDEEEYLEEQDDFEGQEEAEDSLNAVF